MKHLEACIEKLFAARTVRHLAIRVGKGDTLLFETFRSCEGRIDENTLFDMASVTKILSTTSLALMALDEGRLRLQDPVAKFFAYEGKMTVFHLLTHTMGIGHKSLSVAGNTRENIAEKILQIPSDAPVGTEVLYSCPGFILLGRILEQVYGEPLDVLFTKRVCQPLGLGDTGYLPTDKQRAVNANEEEALRGTVNDYNCRHLGGVAGNAGVFSTMRDMEVYAKALLAGLPLISEDTFALAIQNHTKGMSGARGLGYLYVDERYEQTGGLFPAGSFGHAGHTGQSVFVNRESGLYVVILSDATAAVKCKYGKSRYEEVCDMRRDLHAAIKEDLSAR